MELKGKQPSDEFPGEQLVWFGLVLASYIFQPEHQKTLQIGNVNRCKKLPKKLHTITVTKNTQDALAFPRQRTGECLGPAEQNPFDNGKSTLAELCKQENARVDGGSQDGCSWGSQYSRNKQWL